VPLRTGPIAIDHFGGIFPTMSYLSLGHAAILLCVIHFNRAKICMFVMITGRVGSTYRIPMQISKIKDQAITEHTRQCIFVILRTYQRIHFLCTDREIGWSEWKRRRCANSEEVILEVRLSVSDRFLRPRCYRRRVHQNKHDEQRLIIEIYVSLRRWYLEE
jgi:hypothetical protein